VATNESKSSVVLRGTVRMLVVGIDIGGTKIAGALVTPTGEVRTRAACKTMASEGAEAVMARALQIAAELLNSCPGEVAGMGVASGGLIDPRTGVVIHATELLPGWTGMEIAQVFEEHFGLPAKAINDASAAAVGEGRFGAARGVDDFVLLTLGTGVGGGIFSGGRLLLGTQGVAGSIGHMVIDCDGRWCNCGSRGCLEAYVSGTAITDRALQLADERGLDEPLIQAVRADRNAGTQLIGKAASESNDLAIEIVREAGTYLGWGLANLVNLFNPAMIVIGGSVAEMGDLLLHPAREVVCKHSLRGEKDPVRIVKAQLGNDAGTVGAASLIWNPVV